jgi:trimethylamine corrinoid protein
MSEAEIIERMKKSVIEQDEEGAKAAAQDAVAQNLDPIKCIDEGLAAGMNVISDMFEEGEIFVPHILISADAFNQAMEILKPLMKGEKFSKGKVIVHTVEGDIHDIGKNIFKILLQANGFEVIDMGRDVPVEKVIDKAVEEGVDIITGSALMTTTMPGQREIIDGLKERGIRDQFKCMFGGAPVTQEWVTKIDGDGYADNAAAGVRIASKLKGK